MNTRTKTCKLTTSAAGDNSLSFYLELYVQYLKDREYSAHSTTGYHASVSHLACWMKRSRLGLSELDEALVRRFVNYHLPRCNCAGTVRRTPTDVRAALGHLLVVLRAQGAIPLPVRATNPVDEELHRFDGYLEHVRGLAQKTRHAYLRTVGRFLSQRFGQRPVVIKQIKPEALRKFLIEERKRYLTPASAGSLASAMRGYLRYRSTRGDRVHQLMGVVTYPANWQLASLPKALSGKEVNQLLQSLGGSYPSPKRSDAIVRCAIDLGLRSGEIAKISLDDIDWQAGTLTLRRTKGRRDDVMPLPSLTGKAITDYLQHERPASKLRALFLRRVAPRDQLIGPDLVRKTIRQAYARAGLPYTRSHLLRHTLASRLLEGGSSLKEVADVLRHRSLNTTLIYAKLDSRNLSAVALPWPGGAS